jgi:hypothetical protein
MFKTKKVGEMGFSTNSDGKKKNNEHPLLSKKIQKVIFLLSSLRFKFSFQNGLALTILTFIKIKNFYKLRYFLLHLRHPVCSANVITPLSSLHRHAILSSYCRRLMQ